MERKLNVFKDETFTSSIWYCQSYYRLIKDNKKITYANLNLLIQGLFNPVILTFFSCIILKSYIKLESCDFGNDRFGTTSLQELSVGWFLAKLFSKTFIRLFEKSINVSSSLKDNSTWHCFPMDFFQYQVNFFCWNFLIAYLNKIVGFYVRS